MHFKPCASVSRFSDAPLDKNNRLTRLACHSCLSAEQLIHLCNSRADSPYWQITIELYYCTDSGIRVHHISLSSQSLQRASHCCGIVIAYSDLCVVS